MNFNMKNKKVLLKETKKLEFPKLPKEVEVELFISKGETTPKLGHIELDFGREDLNALRSKINEVIDYINASK